jgi:hypothetical protein
MSILTYVVGIVCLQWQACFRKALSMVGAEFLDRVNYYKTAWLPAREIVLKAVNNRHQVG